METRLSTRGPFFALIIVLQLWAAHALVFFTHEYGHSFAAAMLGWKSNPLLLNFGDLSWPNLLAMTKIDERVDYDPIFRSGYNSQAAFIAAAGVLANAAFYPLAIFGFIKCRFRTPAWSMFFFWLCVMCVGNFIDYVPTRCFSPIDDMHTIVSGLGVAPIYVAIGLGVPFLAGGAYLFAKLLPDACQALLPDNTARQGAVVALSTFLIFVFYPSAGLETGEGETAKVIALTCIFGMFPLLTFVCWPRGRAGKPS